MKNGPLQFVAGLLFGSRFGGRCKQSVYCPQAYTYLPHHPLAVCRLSGQFLKVNAHTGHRPGGRAQPCSLPCQRRLSGFWSTLSLALARARSHARIRALQAPRCSSRPRLSPQMSPAPEHAAVICADLSPMQRRACPSPVIEDGTAPDRPPRAAWVAARLLNRGALRRCRQPY